VQCAAKLATLKARAQTLQGTSRGCTRGRARQRVQGKLVRRCSKLTVRAQSHDLGAHGEAFHVLCVV
jgi:hypothetical protein